VVGAEGPLYGGKKCLKISLKQLYFFSLVHIVLAYYLLGLDRDTAVKFAERLGFPDSNKDQAADLFLKLYDVFLSNDCTLLEINPFTELNDGGGLLHGFSLA